MKYLIIAKLSVLFFSFNTVVFAANLGFLNNAPVSIFTGKDSELMEKNLYTALDELADGEQRFWKNEDSSNRGSILIKSTNTEAKQTCRDTQIVNMAKNQKGSTKVTFCKDTDNTWKVSN